MDASRRCEQTHLFPKRIAPLRHTTLILPQRAGARLGKVEPVCRVCAEILKKRDMGRVLPCFGEKNAQL